MDKLSVNITMYPVGELGDCFYLEFTKGETKSTVLIDSGSFRNGQGSIDRMRIIATDLQKQQLQENKRPFDVVIGTHQHNDHYSNFVHSKDIFEKIGTNQVWLSWLDDPKDDHAAKIARGEKEVSRKLRQIGGKLQAAAVNQQGLKDNVAAARINDILGFYYEQDIVGFGKPPVTPQEGLENLKSLVKEPSYLVPGEVISLPGFTQEEVKVYVLGPPCDEKLLFDAHPNKGESYDFKLSVALNSAEGLLAALSNLESDKDNGQSDSASVSATSGKDRSGKIDGTEEDLYEDSFFPFSTDQELKLDPASDFLNQSYNEPTLDWRKIDYDWLNQAERLALYLDTFTNNSSLVLAFELVEAQKVLLFVGDAQTGNWLSWKDIDWKDNPVSLSSLLSKTVLYKVGHHGSHNATLPAALEQMKHAELVAMIPVDASDANIAKPNGWKMPAKNLYKKLKQLTNYRILRMDGTYEPDCDPGDPLIVAKWGPLIHNLSRRKITGLKSDVITYKVE